MMVCGMAGVGGKMQLSKVGSVDGLVFCGMGEVDGLSVIRGLFDFGD